MVRFRSSVIYISKLRVSVRIRIVVKVMNRSKFRVIDIVRVRVGGNLSLCLEVYFGIRVMSRLRVKAGARLDFGVRPRLGLELYVYS